MTVIMFQMIYVRILVKLIIQEHSAFLRIMFEFMEFICYHHCNITSKKVRYHSYNNRGNQTTLAYKLYYYCTESITYTICA